VTYFPRLSGCLSFPRFLFFICLVLVFRFGPSKVLHCLFFAILNRIMLLCGHAAKPRFDALAAWPRWMCFVPSYSSFFPPFYFPCWLFHFFPFVLFPFSLFCNMCKRCIFPFCSVFVFSVFSFFICRVLVFYVATAKFLPGWAFSAHAMYCTFRFFARRVHLALSGRMMLLCGRVAKPRFGGLATWRRGLFASLLVDAFSRLYVLRVAFAL